jgi:ribosomal protein L7/L12
MPDLTDDQLQSILAEIDTKNLIQAIKLYREYTGAGLAEAKAAVEQMAAGQLAPSATPGVQLEPVLAELRAGRKIQAVKLYRQMTGLGLHESKTAVEQLAAANNIPSSKSGCGTSVLLFVSTAIAMYCLLR